MKLQIGIDGKTYEVEVEVLEDDAHQRPPSYAASPALPAASQPMPRPSAPVQAPAAEEVADDRKVCRSPVNGIVIRVNVEPGQSVQTGDLVVVLEAMKMETNVAAQEAGKVKSVRVAQGDSVKVNQVVVDFE